MNCHGRSWLRIMLMLFLIQPSAYMFAASGVDDGEPKRIFHFVLRSVSLERAKWLVVEAKKAGFNTVQVVLTDGVRFDHAVWKPRADAWSKSDFISWVKVVDDHGLEIVPELKLLTHQEKFFQNNFPDLMFNQSTYDPRDAEIYVHIFALLDEIINVTHPKAIHIGHDELAGQRPRSRKKWLKPDEMVLPAELFIQDVVKLNGYLKGKGIETWMWGDMLISPKEKPGMRLRTVSGYGKALRDRMPRDIVICDWRYFDDQSDFPTMDIMQKEGFRVLGATWKKEKTVRNFSGYAAEHNAYGMIATTWWHVQRREWTVVEDIIRFSGGIFTKDFPDAK